MELKDIKMVLALGAGTMGQQIGFVCAMHEYNVTLYNIQMKGTRIKSLIK